MSTMKRLPFVSGETDIETRNRYTTNNIIDLLREGMDAYRKCPTDNCVKSLSEANLIKIFAQLDGKGFNEIIKAVVYCLDNRKEFKLESEETLQSFFDKATA